MAVRGVRGATALSADDAGEMVEAVAELVQAMVDRNGLDRDELISAIFTATPDLVAAFPAAAARSLGLGDLPLLCATEIAVRSSMPRVIRVLLHAETALNRTEVQHIYLRGTQQLRQDLAQ